MGGKQRRTVNSQALQLAKAHRQNSTNKHRASKDTEQGWSGRPEVGVRGQFVQQKTLGYLGAII